MEYLISVVDFSKRTFLSSFWVMYIVTQFAEPRSGCGGVIQENQGAAAARGAE
jgi:hypothetical protein